MIQNLTNAQAGLSVGGEYGEILYQMWKKADGR